DRGDQLEVATVPFAPEADQLAPLPSDGFFATVNRQLGTILNALIVLIVAALLIWFGLRPAVKALTAQRESATINELIAEQEGEGANTAEEAETNLIEDLKAKMNKTPQKRLEQLVDYDSEKAAALLKQWLLQAERA
ncbi:MAG: flagellar M-ring protein FliF, partial [Pseudomonadota bacterium]